MGHGFGPTELEQRARTAFGREYGRRRDAGTHHRVNGRGERGGLRAKGMIKRHLVPTMLGTVEEGSGGDGNAEHFFEADRLGAELNGVDRFVLGPAAFVFDREWAPDSVGVATKFNDVGDAVESKGKGLQGKGTSDANIAA